MTTIPDSVQTRQEGQSTVMSNRWFWAVLLLGIVLRFVFLSRESLWLDEAASVDIARRSWHDFVRVLWQGEANMTTFYLALRSILLHIGDSEFWVRFPAAVAGIATIPVMFRLGEAIFDRRTALVTALLAAVSPCDVSYSREARGYSMAVLFSALSILWFIRAIDRRSAGVWLAYAAMSALAVYSHFYAGLVIVAELLSLCVLPSRNIPWKQLVLSAVLIGALTSPLLVVALSHNVGQLNWVQKLSWLEVYHTAVFFAADEGKVLGNILLVFALFALGNAARKTWMAYQRNAPLVDRWRYILLWAWLLAPPVVVALLSIHTPLFFHRFFIVSLPAFLLLVSWGLSGFRRSPVSLCLFAILSVVTVAQHYRRTRENWRDATSYVLEQAQPGDAAFFFHRYSLGPFTYYRSLQNKHPIPELREDEVSRPSDYRRLWVILYPVGPSDPAVDATFVRLKEDHRVLQEAEFRRIRVLLVDLGKKPD
jgi:mannosyltransferase